ncbi:MAG: pre-peptidase C-terminal domain-containing protein [Gammaproteobacteria bacterium]|nr:pre-peptidase C-terminal domain-containing protein [Gammaproteobacteria bacterium]
MPEYLRVCQDRLLPKDLVRPQRTIGMGGGASRAIIVFLKRWINGSELHVRFMGGTHAQQALAKEQAQWWTQHANLTFVFDNAPNAEIRITFDSSDGAWSYIGTDASSIPTNQPTMNLGFLDGGTAAHEFGHAIGLAHEHSNPAGGIEWNEEVVLRDLMGPPNNWTPDQIRHNVLNKYSADQIRGTGFDRDSIMLYFFPDTWVKSGEGTKENDVLSNLDKEFIASTAAYPRVAVQAVELGVNAAPAPATIGVPGEEDLFKFTVTSGGRHTIETDGQTDVVMKLFGPNSQTSLIAEDDDGGVGLNARIVADIIPGQYFVPIRHFNKARGTGSYSIRVSR